MCIIPHALGARTQAHHTHATLQMHLTLVFILTASKNRQPLTWLSEGPSSSPWLVPCLLPL